MDDIHECEWKKGKMWDLLVDKNGRFYCKRCMEIIPENQVEPIILLEKSSKYRGEVRRRNRRRRYE